MLDDRVAFRVGCDGGRVDAGHDVLHLRVVGDDHDLDLVVVEHQRVVEHHGAVHQHLHAEIVAEDEVALLVYSLYTPGFEAVHDILHVERDPSLTVLGVLLDGPVTVPSEQGGYEPVRVVVHGALPLDVDLPGVLQVVPVCDGCPSEVGQCGLQVVEDALVHFIGSDEDVVHCEIVVHAVHPSHDGLDHAVEVVEACVVGDVDDTAYRRFRTTYGYLQSVCLHG